MCSLCLEQDQGTHLYSGALEFPGRLLWRSQTIIDGAGDNNRLNLWLGLAYPVLSQIDPSLLEMHMSQSFPN